MGKPASSWFHGHSEEVWSLVNDPVEQLNASQRDRVLGYKLEEVCPVFSSSQLLPSSHSQFDKLFLRQIICESVSLYLGLFCKVCRIRQPYLSIV